ncbi:MAG: DedA family protein [candidate division Zixibacteria bacterium]|nr:DedA family protein [candidate division Zixibacteria bacterium]
MTESILQISEYLDYLFAYGSLWVYLVIFIACFVENLFPPFPGDTFILAGGGLVAVGRLELLITVITILSGGICSVMILYFFGKRYGRDYFLKKNFKYFTANDIKVIEEKFSKWGGLILLLSRFFIGVRSALAVVAGISRYNFSKLILYTLISYCLFAGLLIYLAIALVENFDKIISYIKTYNLIFWPILTIVICWFVYVKIKNVRLRA